jgi:hypothetical protein
MGENSLNALNRTEVNDIKRVNGCLNNCLLGEHRINPVEFYMHEFVYLSLLYS